MNSIRIIPVALLLILVSACASVPKQSFNAEAHSDIKTIGILKPNTPKAVNINIINHAGYQFGLVGGLIAAAELATKESKYNSSIENESFDLSAYLQERVGHYLSEAGYQVVLIDASRENASYLEDYSTLSPATPVDAYVDMYIRGAGYIAGSHYSSYKPTVWVPVRLIHSDSKEILYTDEIYCGYHFSQSEAVHITSGMKYQYYDFDSLVSSSTESVEGLKLSEDKIARKIAEHLARASEDLAQDTITQ